MTEDDFLELFSSPVGAVKTLTEVLLQPPVYGDELPPDFGVPLGDIVSHGSVSPFFNNEVIEHTMQKEEEAGADTIQLQFLVTSFKYNFHPGSRSSLRFLEAIENARTHDMLSTKLVLIIDQKWNYYKKYLVL